MGDQAVGRVVLRDGAGGRWREFSAPRQIFTTDRIDEVLPLVRQIEAQVEATGLHAAGFIAYEAAPAFDPKLAVRPDGAFPLIWFGLFQQVGEIELAAGEPLPALDWQPSVARGEYDACLRAIRAYIRAGDTYQVNFSYRLRAVADVDPWQLFAQIAGDGESPFAAFVDTGEWAICSASPELFLHIDGQQIESRPMKGTAARGLWPEEDYATRDALLASEKDRAENVMIVDMVRNDLGRVAELGSVHVPALFSAERYPTVWQLTSTVAARSHAPLDRVLQATFPPASITGAPKRRTMEIIAELETSPRRIYTGTIGFLAPGRQAQLNVAIRTVLLHRPTRQAEYGVGGGVVWDSTAAGEYQESRTKARVLAPRPRDFDLLETMLWSPEGGYALLEHHLARLARSADYFGFRMGVPQIRAELASLAAGLPAAPHRVRLLLARAGAVRCQAVALGPDALRFGDVALAAQPVDRRDVFLYHKTTRRAVYEDALRLRPGQRDVLLFNAEGHATETTVANIAVDLGGTLYTPPVRCGLLAGTQRAMLLEQGRIHERVLTIQDVLQSPRIYLLNSVRGMQQVQIVG